MMPPAPTKVPGLGLRGRRSAALALLLAAAAISPPTAHAADAGFEGASADGTVVFFSTTEQVVPGDTDTRRDVFVRSFDPQEGDYVTRLISTGPEGGNGPYAAEFEKVSADGTKVFFSTREKLVAADVDGELDVYLRKPDDGTTELVSLVGEGCGASCGNGPGEATFTGATDNGNVAFFVTSERFVPADTDSAVDVYYRNLETATTKLVSAGAAACAPSCGNEGAVATLRGASPDGGKAFFSTAEPLTEDDTDNDLDIYSRDLPGGPTVRLSQGAAACAPGCGNGSSLPAVFAATDSDGSAVYIETSEALDAGDADESNDVYLRSGGTTSLVSAGSEVKPANLKAISGNGGQALFVTSESLDGADTNGASDVYKWSGGSPVLVTSGTCTQGSGCGVNFNAATADAALLFFTTTEQLTAGDTDSSADVYRVSTSGGAEPDLVSAGGNGAFPATFAGSSADGGVAYLLSFEALVPGPDDEDSNRDLFRRDIGAATTTLSTPAGTCPLVVGCDVTFHANSTDAEHAFLVTKERLGEGDSDSDVDVYERDESAEPAETRLVSTGNSAGVAPSTPLLTGTSPVSPGTSTTPAILGQADAETAIKIYTSFDCSGSPVATGSAAQLGGVGIEVSVPPNSSTSFRATSTDGDGDTSDCSLAIAYKHEEGSEEEEGEEEPPPPPPPPPPLRPRRPAKRAGAIAAARARPPCRASTAAASHSSRRRR